MVDPSKDQFYQQQLAPWSHLGQASGYPATHQGHGMYSAPRLNHSFPGLVPEAPSPAPPPPTSTASHHAAAGAATHPYYPMHLAALSAAAVAASDFSRPLPAHSPATAHSGASASAPLPAHLSRHPYQNYHHAYMPNYYGNHTPTMTQARYVINMLCIKNNHFQPQNVRFFILIHTGCVHEEFASLLHSFVVEMRTLRVHTLYILFNGYQTEFRITVKFLKI